MLSNFISELRSTTKPKEKQAILKKYDSPMLREVIDACYNPFRLFHVKINERDIPFVDNAASSSFDDVSEYFLDLLNHCENCNSSKANKLKIVDLLSQVDTNAQELIVGTINKNFKAGLGSTIVLREFPGLFPKFEVQLANSYAKYLLKKKQPVSDWWCTDKLDGVRCAALRADEGTWSFTSRQGHPFLTVDHLSEHFENLYTKFGYTFWDGELYKHGLTFEEVQGAVMAFKKGPAPEIEYHAFIAGQAEDFFAGKADSMVIATEDIVKGGDKVKAVPVKMVNKADVYDELELAFEAGYEGIMLRNPDKLYDFKRSDALLKLKENVKSALSEEEISDCLVTDIITDTFPVIKEVDGKNAMTFETLLVKLRVEQKDGTICSVGSGFDLDFRYKYTESPEDIIGKIIEVKHQGVGKLGRMRFPRLFRERRDLVW